MERGRRPPQPLRLDTTAERLLRWLERYPFQRACDLQVALALWAKRTVVYERLAELERDRLLEVLHPPITRGRRLYHLSPLGVAVGDRLSSQSDQYRWEQGSRALLVREEREKLMRVLPRLPVSLLVQDLVNGLVRHASSALTDQGRQARMVQWSWLRDYDHAFLAAHDTRLHLRVEGALALCWRFSSVDRSSSPFEPETLSEECWSTFLLLHCPLDEVRLIRSRLDRLLRWRESAERTIVYSQMPPLLILATTERQAEWWHQAAIQVAARLRVALPSGGVVCLPHGTSEGLANGWRLSWQRLGTRERCPLQELVHSFSTPAIPELLVGRGAARERDHAGGATATRKIQMVLPTGLRVGAFALAGSEATRSKPPRLWSCDWYRASLALTPRHWEILHLCFAHPLLSRENLSHLLALTRTTVNLLLADLTRARYLARATTPVDDRWHLTETGLDLLARLAWCPVRRLRDTSLEEGRAREQRGVAVLRHQIHHTAGVYAFFSLLIEALATHPQAGLRWWETGAISERHFRFHEKTYRFRPDAQACVQVGERQIRFWLEWDRGTMTPRDLRIKFATYAMYLLSREWASSSPFLPALLCVTPHSGPHGSAGCPRPHLATGRFLSPTADASSLGGHEPGDGLC